MVPEDGNNSVPSVVVKSLLIKYFLIIISNMDPGSRRFALCLMWSGVVCYCGDVFFNLIAYDFHSFFMNASDLGNSHIISPTFFLLYSHKVFYSSISPFASLAQNWWSRKRWQENDL